MWQCGQGSYSNFKEGNGIVINSQNMYQKVGNKLKIEWNSAVNYRTKVHSKAFAIPILPAIISNIVKTDAVRIGIANVSELTFIL